MEIYEFLTFINRRNWISEIINSSLPQAKLLVWVEMWITLNSDGAERTLVT